MKHLAFPSIEQFKNAIRAVKQQTNTVGFDAAGEPVYDSLKPPPTLKYRGSVKLHGCNAAIVLNYKTGEKQAQSRERILTVEDDNYGFAKFVASIDTDRLFSMVPSKDAIFADPKVPSAVNPPVKWTLNTPSDDQADTIAIYGEWCGGNIQPGEIALGKIEKQFVIFAITYDGWWVPNDIVKTISMPESKVFNINEAATFEATIDFSNPELAQNTLITITDAVEKECPYALIRGVSGIGEGVVWRPVDPAWDFPQFWFKVKGKKHSSSKVTTLAAVDIEKANSLKEFVDRVATENRILQGIGIVKQRLGVSEFDKKNLGDLIGWVYNDVIKEESDTMKASGIDPKKLGGPLATAVRTWYFKNGGNL